MADTSDSEQMVYLYGDLDLKIFEARHLPNMDFFALQFSHCFAPCEAGQHPPSPPRRDKPGDRRDHHTNVITSDPYVKVCVPQTTLARTRVISNTQNPYWDESFTIPLAHPAANLKFEVKDNDVLGAELIGTVVIPAQKISSGEPISGWFPVLGPSGKPPKPQTALRIEMQFTPCDKNPRYLRGIPDDPDQMGVRRSYFPLRRGGSLTLYQDAHVPEEMASPGIELDGGREYIRGQCWEDLCHAIVEAHHMIYVVGWSVFHKIKLIREPTRPLPRGGDLTLGELLKYKSEEGVRVLMLVWDDKFSDKLRIWKKGSMETHDEETRNFFKHSSVICVLSPRYASGKLSFIKQRVVGTIFSHHQKCVLVDTQAHGNNRKITAFLGGLDLCDGRYDTPEHRILKDLDTVFKGDFHNPTFSAGGKTPREPWHDLHCRIEGPAAYDVLMNFEQRWKKATRWREFGLHVKKMYHWKDDSLLKIDRISWILSPPPGPDGEVTSVPEDDPLLYVSREDDPEHWHIQVFRSIDSGSLLGFPKTVHAAYNQHLVSAKNLVVDKSVQTAYIQAIRSAQHFIYIENQYFLGSSYAWPSYKHAGADNLIPMELALKIASKIRAKERFAVYIVIPMWPEGDPKGLTVQEILYWQGQTMEMMYEVVAKELKSMQMVDSHPLDYLNFYCLGKREGIAKDMSEEASPTPENANEVPASTKFGRFMIYVHAKGMIVDDEYVILGSANINQRSMAGTKDTEIAMGAYQPHHSWAKKKNHPHGQVYGYRMSLWAEHLGMVNKQFKEPETVECVRTVNEMAEENWNKFAAEEFTPLQGHLLKYPIQVDADGKVGPKPGHENFPDAGGHVRGTHSLKMPDSLTT